MGRIFVDSREEPVSGMALLGDFCFLAGRPDKEIVLHKLNQDFVIMVP